VKEIINQGGNMKKILIIGSSGHAKVVIDTIQHEGKYEIVGLIDKFRNIGEETLGYKVLGTEEDIPKIMKNDNINGVIIAIGDNFIRKKVVNTIQKIVPSICFVSAIHPHASIGKKVDIKGGTVVMAGAVINPNSVIKHHCIVNTNASLDHDSEMDSFASLAPNVCTGGGVRIGECSAISIGATLLHQIKIGKHTIIGASALVTKDVDSYKIAYGTPAKEIRARKEGESYL